MAAAAILKRVRNPLLQPRNFTDIIAYSVLLASMVKTSLSYWGLPVQPPIFSVHPYRDSNSGSIFSSPEFGIVKSDRNWYLGSRIGIPTPRSTEKPQKLMLINSY